MLKPAVPMNSNPTLLEPSFVDAMIAIGKADDLSDQHRRHWSCSLKQIGKWLDRPLSLISGPLDLGADARGAIAPCPGRRHGQDNGQSQVKRPGCASLVQQRARRAAPWRTAIAEVADFARQHQGRRTTGPALRLDALLLGARHRTSRGQRQHSRLLLGVPRQDHGIGRERHGAALHCAGLERRRDLHLRLAEGAAQRARS